MITNVTLQRLVAGHRAGHLRVVVELTIDNAEEALAARSYSQESMDVVHANTQKRVRERGAGPIAARIAEVMRDAVARMIDDGAALQQHAAKAKRAETAS